MWLFSVKYGKNLTHIIRAALEEGDEIPEPIQNAPVLKEEHSFYWQSFLDLNNCRRSSFDSIEAISWFDVYNYCKTYDINDIETIRDVYSIIQRVDNKYLEYLDSKMAKKTNKK